MNIVDRCQFLTELFTPVMGTPPGGYHNEGNGRYPTLFKLHDTLASIKTNGSSEMVSRSLEDLYKIPTFQHTLWRAILKLYGDFNANPRELPATIKAFLYLNYEFLCVFDLDNTLVELDELEVKWKEMKELTKDPGDPPDVPNVHVPEHSGIIATRQSILYHYYDLLDDVVFFHTHRPTAPRKRSMKAFSLDKFYEDDPERLFYLSGEAPGIDKSLLMQHIQMLIGATTEEDGAAEEEDVMDVDDANALATFHRILFERIMDFTLLYVAYTTYKQWAYALQTSITDEGEQSRVRDVMAVSIEDFIAQDTGYPDALKRIEERMHSKASPIMILPREETIREFARVGEKDVAQVFQLDTRQAETHPTITPSQAKRILEEKRNQNPFGVVSKSKPLLAESERLVK
jgi:hypothetical protein